MAYNEQLAQRVRHALSKQENVVEKKMFGGLAFLVRGHMCCGVTGNELMVRVGPQGYKNALEQSHSREMDFTGKPLRGFVYVAKKGFDSEDDLRAWLARATDFVRSLPPK